MRAFQTPVDLFDWTPPHHPSGKRWCPSAAVCGGGHGPRLRTGGSPYELRPDVGWTWRRATSYGRVMGITPNVRAPRGSRVHDDALELPDIPLSKMRRTPQAYAGTGAGAGAGSEAMHGTCTGRPVSCAVSLLTVTCSMHHHDTRSVGLVGIKVISSKSEKFL